MNVICLTRRQFLASTGIAATGLLLGISGCARRSGDSAHAFEPNIFIALQEDGELLITVTRSEMGQGVRSSLPQIVADEMDADWQRVRVVQAIGHERYGDQNTDGSASVRGQFQRLRKAGASARILLLQAAALHWQVPINECETEPHVVIHTPSGRRLGYGELASAAAALPQPPSMMAKLRQFKLKTPEQFRYIGKPIAHLDSDDIMRGRARYGIDVQRPGLLHASIEHSPVVGGKVIKVDDSAALAVLGVRRVIAMPTPAAGPGGFSPLAGVAVIAENTWAAQRGREALKIEWDLGPNQNHDSETYLTELLRSAQENSNVTRELITRNNGDIDAAFAAAAKTFEASYTVPYLAHATMEPVNATAEFHTDEKGVGRCEIWAPTQAPQRAQSEAAKILGIEPAAVTVHVTLLGGGFGRKSKPDYSSEAAWLARELGAPVKVTWSRSDDMRHDFFHGISAQTLRGAIDANGRTIGWHHRAQYPSIGTTFSAQSDNTGGLNQGATNLLFNIPNIRVEGGAPSGHLRIGWLRSVCHIQHSFAVNSFACELAHAAGRDAGDYLLELIGDNPKLDLGVDSRYVDDAESPLDRLRLRAVTEKAMALADWHTPLPAGHGRGIAAQHSFFSYVAAVIEVSSAADGKIKLERIVSVADVGLVVNPDRVRAQLEGGAIFGLGIALHNRIDVKNGRVQQSNFHDYPIPRISEVPPIVTHILDSDHAPTGIGEPGTPPIAPALCNAVFAATGKRIRDLPLAKHGLV